MANLTCVERTIVGGLVHWVLVVRALNASQNTSASRNVTNAQNFCKIMKGHFQAYCENYNHKRPQREGVLMKKWNALLDTVLLEKCDCDERRGRVPWPHYCLWCFQKQGCARKKCTVIFHCEHPGCNPTKPYVGDMPVQGTSICQQCLNETDHCGWEYGIAEKSGKIALFCPRHKKSKNQRISISMFPEKEEEEEVESTVENTPSPKKRIRRFL